MYDDESKAGIRIYTLVFVIVLVSFIGFIIYRGIGDKDTGSNNKHQTRSQIKSQN